MKKGQEILVTGVQPTGKMHIGNWAGTLRNCVALQDAYAGRFFLFVADYHSMTIDYAPEEKRGQVFDVAATLLALGIDPKKVVLFAQSDVPEHTELCWIFNTVTPVAEMERMTQYKDKSAHHAKNINMGLLDYPVLQAADVLLYDGAFVPVGTDQVQHVETMRVIARNFNKRFGAAFPEPEPLLTETPRVCSVTEPTKKMSKSHGEKSCIYLDDLPGEIADKLKRVPTEPSGYVETARLGTPEYAGVASLLSWMELFGSKEERETWMRQQPIKYGDLKKRVAEVIADRFAGYRKRKAELVANPDHVWTILAAGAERARAAARAKMEVVRKKTGLR